MEPKAQWQRQAECRSFPPELFFPRGTSDAAQADRDRAKAVCRRCPVRAACLEFALETRQEFGVWGGLSEDERLALVPAGPVRPRARAVVVTR